MDDFHVEPMPAECEATNSQTEDNFHVEPMATDIQIQEGSLNHEPAEYSEQ